MSVYTYKELEVVVEEQAKKDSNLTAEQFSNLARNIEGDIIDLSLCFFLISDSQRKELSEDDWSRMDMLEEDLRCMMYSL